MSKDLTFTPEEFRKLIEAFVSRANHAGDTLHHAPAGSEVIFTKNGSYFTGKFLRAAHQEDVVNLDGSLREVLHQTPCDSEINAKFTIAGLFTDAGSALVSEDVLMMDPSYTMLDVNVIGFAQAQDIHWQF